MLSHSLSNEYFLGQVLETCPTMLFMDSNLILIWAAGTTNQGMVEQWFFSRVFANISTGMIWEKQVRRTTVIKAGQKYKDENDGVRFLFGAL